MDDENKSENSEDLPEGQADSTDDRNEAGDEKAVAAQADVIIEGARAERDASHGSLKKKVLIIVIIVAVLGGAGTFFALSSSTNTDEAASENTEQSENQEEVEQVAEPTMFDQIVYAHGPTYESSKALYSRPAAGGDRVDLDFSFGAVSLERVSRSGQSFAVYDSEGAVYYGSGNTIQRSAYVVPASQEVSGFDMDDAGESILITSVERAGGSGNTIHAVVINMTDDSSSQLFTKTGISGGIVAEYWDSEDQSFLGYETNCWGCEGSSLGLKRFDSSGNESVLSGDVADLSSLGTENGDGTKSLYIKSTTYTDQEAAQYGLAGGIGAPSGAPFDIMIVDLVNGTESKLITVGEVGDLNDDGYFDWPKIAWATRSDGSEAPVYSYLTKLFVENQQGNFDNYFETSSNNISSIYAVDSDELLVGSRLDDGERLSYFNIETQEGAIVMETLFSTTILGITLK